MAFYAEKSSCHTYRTDLIVSVPVNVPIGSGNGRLGGGEGIGGGVF